MENHCVVSTLYYLFSGQKELFKNLYLRTSTDYDFKSYPVLQFNFADFGLKNKHLEKELSHQLQGYAQEYHIQLKDISLATPFKTLVQAISKQHGKVVILIDEYDKPIVDFLTDIAQTKKNQEILRNFFSPLKGLEAQGHLRFLFITGISKFSKVSLFSDLNNLTDLTMHPLSNDLLGITQEELLHYFDPYIEQVTLNYPFPKSELLQEIKRWYNGYSYNGSTFLYNPYSLLSLFSSREFKNY
ncbi:MAG: AAA family ATPase [Saprospiraceae bacterium]|nr:AAA family ATPase [Saprospiraceae bacterium]